MAVADSMLAQYATATLVTEDGTPLGTDGRVMAELTKFDAKWVPDIYKKWPAGASKYHHQLVGGYYEVQMTADQMGGGFLALAKIQKQQMQRGVDISTLRLTRTIRTKGGWTYTETFTGGIITSATNAQTDGNKPLTTDVTIEFEDMS